LGEIGGTGVLKGVAARLGPDHAIRHYLIVRLASHLAVRYLAIQEEGLLTETVIDLNTGEANSGSPMAAHSLHYQMEVRQRRETNEYFTPVEQEVINHLVTGLARVPDSLLNMKRHVFSEAIDRIPILRRA
jgi:hypothetical protein